MQFQKKSNILVKKMAVQKKLIAGNWKMNMLHVDAAALTRDVVAGAEAAPGQREVAVHDALVVVGA